MPPKKTATPRAKRTPRPRAAARVLITPTPPPSTSPGSTGRTSQQAALKRTSKRAQTVPGFIEGIVGTGDRLVPTKLDFGAPMESRPSARPAMNPLDQRNDGSLSGPSAGKATMELQSRLPGSRLSAGNAFEFSELAPPGVPITAKPKGAKPKVDVYRAPVNRWAINPASGLPWKGVKGIRV